VSINLLYKQTNNISRISNYLNQETQ